MLWLALDREERIIEMKEEEERKKKMKENLSPEEKRKLRLETALRGKKMWKERREIVDDVHHREDGEDELEHSPDIVAEAGYLPQDLQIEGSEDPGEGDGDDQPEDLGQVGSLCEMCVMTPCTCALLVLEMRIKMLKTLNYQKLELEENNENDLGYNNEAEAPDPGEETSARNRKKESHRLVKTNKNETGPEAEPEQVENEDFQPKRPVSGRLVF